MKQQEAETQAAPASTAAVQPEEAMQTEGSKHASAPSLDQLQDRVLKTANRLKEHQGKEVQAVQRLKAAIASSSRTALSGQQSDRAIKEALAEAKAHKEALAEAKAQHAAEVEELIAASQVVKAGHAAEVAQLTKAIDHLQTEADQLNATNGALRAQHEQAQSQVIQLKATLHSDVDQLAVAIGSLTSEHARQISELTNLKDIATAKVDELTANIDALTSQLHAAAAEHVAQTQAKEQQHAQQVAHLTSANQAMAAQLAAAEEARQSVTAAAAAKLEQEVSHGHSARSKMVEEHQACLTALQQQHTEQMQQQALAGTDSLAADNRKLQHSLDEASSKLESSTAECASLRASLQESDSKCKAASDSWSASQCSLSKCEDMLASLQAEYASAQTALLSANSTVSKAMTERDAAVSAATNSSAMLTALQDKYALAQIALESANSTVTLMTEERNSAVSALNSNSNMLSGMQADKDAAHSALASAQSAMAETAAERDSAVASMSNISGMLSSITAEKDAAQSALASANSTVAQLTEERNAAVAAMSNASGLLSSITSEKDAAHAALVSANAAVAQITDERDTAVASLNSVSRMVADITAEKDAVKYALDLATSKLSWYEAERGGVPVGRGSDAPRTAQQDGHQQGSSQGQVPTDPFEEMMQQMGNCSIEPESHAGTGTAQVPRSAGQQATEAAFVPSDIAMEQIPMCAPASHHQQSQPQQHVAADGMPTLDELMSGGGMQKCPVGAFAATSMPLDDKYIRATYFTNDSFPTSMAPPACSTASEPDMNFGVTAEAQPAAEAHTSRQTSSMGSNDHGMLGSDAQPAEAYSTMQDSNVFFGHAAFEADMASSHSAIGDKRQGLLDSTAALSDFLQQDDDSMNVESNSDSLLNTADSSAHASVDNDTTGMPFMTSDAPASSAAFHMLGSDPDSSSAALEGTHFDDISWEGVFDDAAPFADLSADHSSANNFPEADCTSRLGDSGPSVSQTPAYDNNFLSSKAAGGGTAQHSAISSGGAAHAFVTAATPTPAEPINQNHAPHTAYGGSTAAPVFTPSIFTSATASNPHQQVASDQEGAADCSGLPSFDVQAVQQALSCDAAAASAAPSAPAPVASEAQTSPTVPANGNTAETLQSLSKQSQTGSKEAAASCSTAETSGAQVQSSSDSSATGLQCTTVSGQPHPAAAAATITASNRQPLTDRTVKNKSLLKSSEKPVSKAVGNGMAAPVKFVIPTKKQLQKSQAASVRNAAPVDRVLAPVNFDLKKQAETEQPKAKLSLFAQFAATADSAAAAAADHTSAVHHAGASDDFDGDAYLDGLLADGYGGDAVPASATAKGTAVPPAPAASSTHQTGMLGNMTSDIKSQATPCVHARHQPSTAAVNWASVKAGKSDDLAWAAASLAAAAQPSPSNTPRRILKRIVKRDDDVCLDDGLPGWGKPAQ